MRHHERIIGLRRRGLKPLCLWLTDVAPLDLWSVQYEPGDSPATADLRFVKGLVVKVEGESVDAVKAWAKACERAGAMRVLWVTHRIERRGEFADVEIVAMGDTENILVQ